MPMPKIKTYIESKGGDPFDWYKFLLEGPFTSTSLMDAKEKAGRWPTCACGNQCDIIPRFEAGRDNPGYGWKTGEPFDERLRQLGLKFGNVIGLLFRKYRDIYKNENGSLNLPDTLAQTYEEFTCMQLRALYILDRIEDRSDYLIKQIYAQNKK